MSAEDEPAPAPPIALDPLQRAFEAFCIDNGVSGVMIWADRQHELGARPRSGCQLAFCENATKGHSASVVYACGIRLREFYGWVKNIVETSR